MSEKNYKLFKHALERALVKAKLMIPMNPENPSIRPTPLGFSRNSLSPVSFDNELWGNKHYKIALENQHILTFDWLEQFGIPEEEGDCAVYITFIKINNESEPGLRVARRSFRRNKDFNWSEFDTNELIDALLFECSTQPWLPKDINEQIDEDINNSVALIDDGAIFINTFSSIYELNLTQISQILPEKTSLFNFLRIKEIRFKGSNERHYFEIYTDTINNLLYIRYFIGAYDTKSVVLYFKKDEQSEKIFTIPFKPGHRLDLTKMLNDMSSQMMVSQLCP